MAKSLSHLQVRAIKEPGTWCVSDQLYLQIRASDKPDQQGTRSWLFRYRRYGKHHWMGIGSCELLPLAEARARVLKLRQLLSDGVDPLAARRGGRLNLSGTGPLLITPENVPSAEEPATKETAPTFRECVASYIESHGSRWHNPKHAQHGPRLWRPMPGR